MAKYYVVCDDDCRYEGMTREQILSAIEQAVEQGHVSDPDGAVFSKIKEIRANAETQVWVGTEAQYNAISPVPSVGLSIVRVGADGVLYLCKDDSTLEKILNFPLPDVESVVALDNRVAALETFQPRPFEFSGNPIVLVNYENMPMKCVVDFESAQSGSGDPSPDNIRQISGRDSVKLTRCGKNLLKRPYVSPDGYTSNGITYTVNEDGSVTVNGTASAESLFQLANMYLRPGTYFVNGVPEGNFGGNTSVQIYFNGIKKAIYSGGGAVTITSAGNYIAFIDIPKGNTLENVVFRPMMVVGAEGAGYEPYQGNAYTLNLGQTVYGGTLDVNSGVLTLTHGFVALNGGENITTRTGGDDKTYYMLESLLYQNPGANILALISSHYPTTNEVYAGTQGVRLTDTGNSIMLRDARYQDAADVEGVKGYLEAQNAAGTPVQVAYLLKNPQTIQLTPAEIAALAGTNTLYTDGDDLTVSGRTDILWLTSHLAEQLAGLTDYEGVEF